MTIFVLVTSNVPILWVASMYTAPGANWPLAFLIAFFPTLFMGALYAIIGASMPRSGGDYVFASRALHPIIGFVNSWGITIAYLIVLGIEAFLDSTYFGYLFAGLGAFYHNDALTSLGVYVIHVWPSFIFAVVLIAVSALIAMLRPSHAWGIVFWGGLVTIVASFVTEVALAGISPQSFQAAYNGYIGNQTAYSGVIQAGGLTAPTVGFATAAALPFAWLAYVFYNLPTAWSGETKNVKRTMPIAILGGLAIILVYYMTFAYFTTNAFGQPFLDNWSSLAANGNTPIAGVGNFIPFFSLLVYGNTPYSLIMYFLMFLAFTLQSVISFPPLIISQTRYIFSWSFDRVIPENFSKVSERFHTPLLTTFLVAVGGVVGAALFAFLPSDISTEFETLDFTMCTFIFIVPAIAGIVFPYTRKDLYQTAFVAKNKFLLPAITWLGIGSAIYLLYSTYLEYQQGSLPIDPFMVVVYGLVYVSGILIFVWGYFKNKRRGLSLELVFKEIPPE